MKKSVLAVAVLLASGIAFGQQGPPNNSPGQIPDEVIENVEDRLGGEWKISCTGSRTDGKKPGQDWGIENTQMDYVSYGILSHSLINYLNSTYLDAANRSFQQMGVDTRLQIVE